MSREAAKSLPHLAQSTEALWMPSGCAMNDRPFAKLDAAHRIHQARLGSGLNQSEFAALLGMPLSHIAAAEIGNADYQHTMDVWDRVQFSHLAQAEQT